MFAFKYYKYIGVATGCVGLGLAVKYATANDNLYPIIRRNTIATADNVLDKSSSKYDFSAAINDSRETLLRAKELSGTPGVCIAVNVDGKTVWSEGFGLADVENGVPCSSKTVMRIASISKSITMAVVARLWQEGVLDLDKPVQDYVPKYPVHSFEGEKVQITTRMLVSHLSGIRHYKKKEKENEKNKDSETGVESKDSGNSKNSHKQARDTELAEMFMTKKFKSVEDALEIFKDDELFHKPGSKYLYTTYGWTLISAVVEAAAKSTFPKIMTEFFSQMGLKNTYLDYNEPIIYHRSRYYTRPKYGRLENAHIVDNSYKWAGGGFLSTVGDLTKFGDIMLYCYQQKHNDFPGYLKASTLQELWSVKADTPNSLRGAGYGMGWSVVPHRQEFGFGDEQNMTASHSGGAVGASSVLFVLPVESSDKRGTPAGVTVAILGNLDNVNWVKPACSIAQRFDKDVSQRL